LCPEGAEDKSAAGDLARAERIAVLQGEAVEHLAGAERALKRLRGLTLYSMDLTILGRANIAIRELNNARMNLQILDAPAEPDC
jgi:hypothetical protein